MPYDDSPENRLAAVRVAIGNCLTAQQYSVAGRMKMSAQLAELRALEKDLMDEVAGAAGGGSMSSLGIQVPPSA